MNSELDLSNVEAFLRGDLTLEEISRSRRRIDRALVITALLYADPIQAFTVVVDGQLQLQRSYGRVILEIMPGVPHRSTLEMMQTLDLYKNIGVGRSALVIVTPPDRLKHLVDHYRDDPKGGIATFYGPLFAERAVNTRSASTERHSTLGLTTLQLVVMELGKLLAR